LILPEYLNLVDKRLEQITSSFITGRFWNRGWTWVDSVSMKGWTYQETGRFFAALPFTKETWKRVSVILGESEVEYWGKANVNPYQVDSDLELAIDKLLQYGRPYAAIDCIDKIFHEGKSLKETQATSALIAAITSSEPSYLLNNHNIIEVIRALQDSDETDPDQLFRVEWAYLPLLDGYSGASPKLLSNRLATDSSFFCEVIRLVYRSDRGLLLDAELTDQEKAMATNAYRLLKEWKIPPGMRKGNGFSGEDFIAWLQEVKTTCNSSGHFDVALSQIGEVLVYCPPDPSGLWINQNVAEALNAKDAEKMRRGFCIELFNSRGAHWVDPTGQPERDLAEKYRQQAEDVENAGYQRLAASLRGVADSYDRDAERIIAEQDQVDD